MYRKLRSGLIDIGLFYKEPEITGVHSRTLLQEDLFIAEAYDQRDDKLPDKPVTLEELGSMTFMFPRKTHFSIRRIVENAFEGVDFTPQVLAEVDSFILVKKCVAMGMACTISPWSAVHEEVHDKTIMIRPIEGVTISRDIELCLPLDRPRSVAIQETFRTVAEVTRELIQSGAWQYATLVDEPD